MAIEKLALSEAELLQRVAYLEADCNASRMLAHGSRKSRHSIKGELRVGVRQ